MLHFSTVKSSNYFVTHSSRRPSLCRAGSRRPLQCRQPLPSHIRLKCLPGLHLGLQRSLVQVLVQILILILPEVLVKLVSIQLIRLVLTLEQGPMC